jgi:hypothetical protein
MNDDATREVVGRILFSDRSAPARCALLRCVCQNATRKGISQ